MSTEIVVRFYFGESPPEMDDLLCRIARVFSEWPQASGAFSPLRDVGAGPRSSPGRRPDSLSVEQLCHSVTGRRNPAELLSTTSSFNCWRFQNGRAEPGSVGLWLEAWGDAWVRDHHEDERIGGRAALSIFDCGPFNALIGRPEIENLNEINSRVAENLDALTGLLFRLVEALNPRAMKVFTDQGLYLPFNAHMSYFRDESVIVDDLFFISEIWAKGLPEHHIAPVREARKEDMRPVFHGWRTPEQRENLWRRIDALLPRLESLSAEDARGAISGNRLDRFDMPTGMTVLDYPYYLNAFVDRIYTDALTGSARDTVAGA
jgi:hypothetical protein